MKDDAVIAQQIVSGYYNNFYKKPHFHSNSVIYKTTNERLSGYVKYLTNKKNILSVIASGEQIINSILNGTKNVECFDISTFPKYFLFLKLAAILTLTKEQYISFFYKTDDTNEKYDCYYEAIREELSEENRVFWDHLFHYFDWDEIYESTLFSSECVIPERVIYENMYLQKENYDKLRSKIKDTNFKIYTGDLITSHSQFKGKYDLIYLSNIINYVHLDKYKDTLDKLSLEDKGIILTYFYVEQMANFFNGSHYEIDKFKDSTSGVIVYHK